MHMHTRTQETALGRLIPTEMGTERTSSRRTTRHLGVAASFVPLKEFCQAEQPVGALDHLLHTLRIISYCNIVTSIIMVLLSRLLVSVRMG
jgi:hypothetical protein